MNVGEAVHFFDQSAVYKPIGLTGVIEQRQHVFDYLLVDSEGREVELEVDHDNRQVVVR